MPNICLIHPPGFIAPKSLSYFEPIPPLGLAYIAGSLKAKGFPLQVIDAAGEAFEQRLPQQTTVGEIVAIGLTHSQIVDRIDHGTEIVGIANTFLHEWKFISELIPLIRKKFPTALLLMGGENTTGMWKQILETTPDLNLCVLGEGEETLLEVIAAHTQQKPLSSISGIAFAKNGIAIKTIPHARTQAINAIPAPAWDLFPLENYFKRGINGGVFRGRSLPMLTSRGCPFQCTFCSSPQMWTTKYISREPALVVDEIATYQQHYGVENIDINDLTSFFSKKWILKFCEEVEKRQLKFTWQLPSGSRSEAIDPETARALYRSGCRNFAFAPESGSPRLLKEKKKAVNLEKLLVAAKNALKGGMKVNVNIVMGFMGETWRDLLQSYLFTIRLAFAGVHTVAVTSFHPYPGSEDFEQLEKEGKIEFNDRYLFASLLRSGAVDKIYNPNYTRRTLIFAQYLFLLTFFSLQFLLRPWRIMQVCLRLLKNTQETVLEKFILMKIGRWKMAYRTNTVPLNWKAS